MDLLKVILVDPLGVAISETLGVIEHFIGVGGVASSVNAHDLGDTKLWLLVFLWIILLIHCLIAH